MIDCHPVPKLSPLAVFRNFSYTRMWLAQLISTIGDSFTYIAAGILVYQQTGSVMLVGLVEISAAIPAMLLGTLAGVIVDRFNRKKIMVITDIFRGLLLFLIPVLVQYSLVWMYLILFLSSALNAFFQTSYDSVVPEMASDEALCAANSMLSISSFGSTAVGFIASGLLAAYSLSLAFYINAVAYLVSAVILAGIIIAPIKSGEKTNVSVVMDDLKYGVRYLAGSKILRTLILISVLYALMAGMENTLLLPFITGTLGGTSFEYGLQEGLTSICYVIGSLVMAKYSGWLHDEAWVIYGMLIMGVLTIVYSFSTAVPFAIAVITLSGLVQSPYAVAWITLLQRNTDREVRGRVLGANMAFRNLLMVLGMLTAGLADIYGPRLLMQAAAWLNLGIGIVALVTLGTGMLAKIPVPDTSIRQDRAI